MGDYIIIDKKAATYFIHEMNHLSWDWVPQDILDMQIKLRDGRKITIGGLIDDSKKRTEAMGNYLKLALEAQKER